MLLWHFIKLRSEWYSITAADVVRRNRKSMWMCVFSSVFSGLEKILVDIHLKQFILNVSQWKMYSWNECQNSILVNLEEKIWNHGVDLSSPTTGVVLKKEPNMCTAGFCSSLDQGLVQTKEMFCTIKKSEESGKFFQDQVCLGIWTGRTIYYWKAQSANITDLTAKKEWKFPELHWVTGKWNWNREEEIIFIFF